MIHNPKSTIAPRIITGHYKGFKLSVPESARPVTDRVKTYMFDILGDIEGLTCADIFAGSGNLGIEALSRGVSHATFVENDKEAIDNIHENITGLRISESRFKIFTHSVGAFVNTINQTFDLLFVDPPFESIHSFKIETLLSVMHADTILILKVDETDIQIPEQLEVLKDKIMGKNRVLILRKSKL